jgi:hypothetical protein
MGKLSAKETVARVFPSYDQTMATRVIAWLDHCGHQIVEKGSGERRAAGFERSRTLARARRGALTSARREPGDEGS